MNGTDIKQQLLELVGQHEKWRSRCLNLVAAENAMSPVVRMLLASDLAQRYGDYNGRDLRARKYFGTREIVEIEESVTSIATELFRAKYVELRPLSGHTAGNALIMGVCRPGDLVLELDRYSGGHRLATKLSASPLIQLEVEYLPFDPTAFDVNVEQTLELVRRRRPRLIIVGASNFLFPTRIQMLSEGLLEFPETILAYDASHVMGLVAGGRFQDPLVEGAHIVLGGTQKSFPGPQGGLLYSDNDDLMSTVCDTLFPALISNHHLARLPSLGMAMLEMQEWGQAYADQVISNASALANAMAADDLPVVGANRGYTASHTVLLATNSLGDAGALARHLEEADIIVTDIRLPTQLGGRGLRLGVAEVTRRGAGVSTMHSVAELVGDLLLARRSQERIRSDVNDIAATLSDWRFTWRDATAVDRIAGAQHHLLWQHFQLKA